MSLQWFQSFFQNIETSIFEAHRIEGKNGRAYPLSAKLSFKEVSKQVGLCKPCNAVMLVAHRAWQNNHLEVLMENKGKKRRDKSSACLSLWSVVRETGSPNLALKTVSPAKFPNKLVLGTVFGWWNFSPLNCVSTKNTSTWVWTKPARELLCKASKFIDLHFKEETAVVLSKAE